MTYQDKLLDPRWQKRRLEVFQKDNFTCQWCGENGKTLHVHHFVYPKSRNPWESNDSDMVTLCCDCHEFTHLDELPKIIDEIHSMFLTNYDKHGESMKILVSLCIQSYKKS